MFTPAKKLITPFKNFGSQMKLRARRSQAISDDSLVELQISQLVKEEEQRANLKGGVAHDQQDDSILLFDTT